MGLGRQCRILIGVSDRFLGRGYKFKWDHLRLFEDANLEWPAVRGGLGEQMEHLSQPEYECAYYAHNKFPFEPTADSGLKLEPEYIDVNEAITRPCGASGLQSPWKTVFHTITTFLGMVGFSRHYMASPRYPSHQVAARMVGHAFSGFAAGAALSGLLFSLRREASRDVLLTDFDDSSVHDGSVLNLGLDFDSIA